MELTLTLNDSCRKKIVKLAQLKNMDDDELGMYLSESLESILVMSILDELDMTPEDLAVTRSAVGYQTPSMPRKPVVQADEAQSEAFNHNQHNLSSEADESYAEETTPAKPPQKEDGEFDFSFVESNLKNAISSDNVDDDDLANEALAFGSDDDDDEPTVTQKSRKAAAQFTTPKARVLDATFGN